MARIHPGLGERPQHGVQLVGGFRECGTAGADLMTDVVGGVVVAVVPPDGSELALIAERLGFELSAGELAECVDVSAELLQTYAALGEDADPDGTVGVSRDRDRGWYPGRQENRYGGWAWRCHLQEDADDGPLAGTQVAIKDNVAVANLPLRNGSVFCDDYTPTEDATVVSRLLTAGATITGKATASAFCLDALGLDSYPTAAYNPYQTDRAAGGSSTGCGILVATGAVDCAIGSDQGGSIRIPASWAGCCGLKPTHGLVPYSGAVGLDERIDHLGPMAPTVAGCAMVLDTIADRDGVGLNLRQRGDSMPPTQRYAGADVAPAALRVGLLTEGFDLPGVSEPEVDASVRSVAHRLAEAGVDVHEVSAPGHAIGLPPELALGDEDPTTTLLSSDHSGFGRGHQHASALLNFDTEAAISKTDNYPPTAKVIALLVSYLSQRHGHGWDETGHRLGRRLAVEYDRLLTDVDVLLMPTTPMRALPRTSLTTPRDYVAAAASIARNTVPFNITGHPALSVPTELVDGLPVGAMLIGGRGDDATVLAAGGILETVRGPWTEMTAP